MRASFITNTIFRTSVKIALIFALTCSSGVLLADGDNDSEDQDTAKAVSGQDKETSAKPASGSPDPSTMTAAERQAAIARAAIDPSSVLMQLGFLGWTTSSSDNKNISNTGLFQPVLPLTRKNVLRPALPFITTGGPNGKSGIGDLFLLDVQINAIASGSWGWGGVASLPIASDDTLGSGKWEAGPMAMYINKKALAHNKSIFGILLYNQWSFAGKSDRSDVNKLSFQPIYVHRTSWGYLGWTDITTVLDWENDNQFSFPVGLRIGKVFPGKTPLNAYIQPYYTFNNKGRDDVWGIKLSGTFIKPNWMKH